ncbi:MAG: class I SAM-dependent methyltransferase [Candidatus Woesearchaeota archaeon]|nr:class I SAM-dependent methyltransferase [Candidatus Woesearchaeota archaeon]
MDNYYNSIADSYIELHKEEQLSKLRIIKENLNVKKGDFLLDVGCGPCFSSEVFDCNVIGIDPSENLLAKAKKRKGLHLIRGFAESIPFRDREFDFVICVSAVHNFEDIEEGISEIERVAKRDVAVTIMRKSPKADYIRKIVLEKFRVKKEIKEEKDLIIIAERK